MIKEKDIVEITYRDTGWLLMLGFGLFLANCKMIYLIIKDEVRRLCL